MTTDKAAAYPPALHAVVGCASHCRVGWGCLPLAWMWRQTDSPLLRMRGILAHPLLSLTASTAKARACSNGPGRNHQHLKGQLRPMRGFTVLACAQVVCQGHGFVRHQGQGFYDLGMVLSDLRMSHPPRLVRA